MIERCLDLSNLTARKSAFLLGPRSTGKSSLIREQLPLAVYIDLLQAQQRRRFLENPSILKEVVEAVADDVLVVIDEIQLIPELLDEVHNLIETTNKRFLLTGSSARKLKRAHANMLGGRAKHMRFFPLTWWELNKAKKFELDRYLIWGGIPRVYLAENPEDELSDYVDTYLDQEIKAEAVSRNIFGFERFFQQAALRSGDVLNYSKIAQDAQLSPPTVRQYFEILEDTLLGFYLRPWQSPKRKAIQTARFYLFDLGVRWFLSEINVLPEKSDVFGKAFESFIIQEVYALCAYKGYRKTLSFWRTTHQEEVDLIIGDDYAIEIKSATKVNDRDYRHLIKLRDEGFSGELVLVSRDQIRRKKNGVQLWYWEDFLKHLWDDWL